MGELYYADAPTGEGVGVKSALPGVLVVIAGSVDSDPVQFAYGEGDWDSNNVLQCSVGPYDHGSRDIDCIFTC